MLSEQDLFNKAVEFVLRPDIEGGYVNDPSDPGGETKFGISKRKYPNEDIKNMTKERAKEIYYKDYWMKYGCNGLSPQLALAHFDANVNMREEHAAKFLLDTIARCFEKNDDETNHYLLLRRVFYARLVINKPSFMRYFKGWFRRVDDLEKYITEIPGL